MLRSIAGVVLLMGVPAALAQTAVPHTFASGSPARASEVNANFAALVAANNALQARVAALEAADDPLAASDVVGTWKLMGLTTGTGSLDSSKRFASKSALTDGVVTFNQDGTLSAVTNNKSNSFSGKAQDCASRAANTSSTNDGSGPHNHQYTEANCDQNAAAFTSSVGNQTGRTSGGTWQLGPAANSITVTPGDAEPLTIFIVKGGTVGFAIGAEATNDLSNPGRDFSLEVLVRQ